MNRKSTEDEGYVYQNMYLYINIYCRKSNLFIYFTLHKLHNKYAINNLNSGLRKMVEFHFSLE